MEEEETTEDPKNQKAKLSNQFHFIERATQTKNNETQDTVSQTDPPPMYGFVFVLFYVLKICISEMFFLKL